MNFDKASVKSGRIMESGRVIGKYNSDYKETVNITEDGALCIGNSRYEQKVSMYLGEMFPEDLGIKMKLKVKCMGNNGHLKRPIFKLYLGKGKEGEEYYIAYHLEEIYRKNISANFFRTKWSLVVENDGLITVLDEGIYELSELNEYTILFCSKNNMDSGVLSLYIIGDSAEIEKNRVINHRFNGLIPYKSSKVLEISNTGFNEDVWGINSKVCIDDIVISKEEYISKWLRKYFDYYEDKRIENVADDKYIAYLIRNIIEKDSISSEDIYEIFHEYYGYELEKYHDKIEVLDFERFARVLKFYLDPNNLFEMEGYWELVNAKVEEDSRESIEYCLRQGIVDFANKDLKDQINAEDVYNALKNTVDSRYKYSTYRLSVSDLFSDFAVIQKGRKTIIYGNGVSGDNIDVYFAGKKKKVPVINGKWKATLYPNKYSGPHSLIIKDLKNRIIRKNIYM
jgi:hypothetical protein